MLNKIVSFFICLFSFGFLCKSQVVNFQVKDNNNAGQVVIDGQVFYHPTQNYGPTINHEFEIKNISANTLSLSLRKYEDVMNTVSITNSDVAQAYFCFGTNCLPSSVFSYSIELAPGESTLLEAKFDEASVAGHSGVRYKFNNKINTSEALTITLKYDSNVGITSYVKDENAAYLVFPVPAKDVLIVRTSSQNDEIQQLAIYDACGKLCYTLGEGFSPATNHAEINLKSLDAGIYYLHITGKTQAIRRKIIIN